MFNFPLYDGKIKPLRKSENDSSHQLRHQMSVTSAITDLNVTFVLDP